MVSLFLLIIGVRIKETSFEIMIRNKNRIKTSSMYFDLHVNFQDLNFKKKTMMLLMHILLHFDVNK